MMEERRGCSTSDKQRLRVMQVAGRKMDVKASSGPEQRPGEDEM